MRAARSPPRHAIILSSQNWGCWTSSAPTTRRVWCIPSAIAGNCAGMKPPYAERHDAVGAIPAVERRRWSPRSSSASAKSSPDRSTTRHASNRFAPGASTASPATARVCCAMPRPLASHRGTRRLDLVTPATVMKIGNRSAPPTPPRDVALAGASASMTGRGRCGAPRRRWLRSRPRRVVITNCRRGAGCQSVLGGRAATEHHAGRRDDQERSEPWDCPGKSTSTSSK
jgi:hypothetical protein